MVNLVTDSRFDFNRTEEYILSIQVSLDGFSFSVIEPTENRLLVLQSTPVTISSNHFIARRFAEWLKNQEYLLKTYAETKILFYSEKQTFVPAEYYDYEKQSNLAELVFGKQDGHTAKDNYWPNVPGNLIFTVPDSLLEFVDNQFPGLPILHPLTVFNEKILKKTKESEITLALYFGKMNFSVLLYLDGKFWATNTFSFAHPNDVLFYVFSVLKQQGINSQKTSLVLAGEINEEDKNHKILKNHFNNIVFLTSGINLFPEEFRNNQHRFITLF